MALAIHPWVNRRKSVLESASLSSIKGFCEIIIRGEEGETFNVRASSICNSSLCSLHSWKECSDKFNTQSGADLLTELLNKVDIFFSRTKKKKILFSVGNSHLRSLVLKPHLDHSNTESRLSSQSLPHLETSRKIKLHHPKQKPGQPDTHWTTLPS